MKKYNGFNVRIPNTKKLITVVAVNCKVPSWVKHESGNPRSIKGFKFFIYEQYKYFPHAPHRWAVVEQSSGASLGYGSTRDAAIEDATNRIKNAGYQKFCDQVDSYVEKYGALSDSLIKSLRIDPSELETGEGK